MSNSLGPRTRINVREDIKCSNTYLNLLFEKFIYQTKFGGYYKIFSYLELTMLVIFLRGYYACRFNKSYKELSSNMKYFHNNLKDNKSNYDEASKHSASKGLIGPKFREHNLIVFRSQCFGNAKRDVY